MHKTTFDLDIAATHPLCLGYTEENCQFEVFYIIQENAVRQAAGGLFSNALELCCLARCLLNESLSDNGYRVLQKSSVDIMKRVRDQTATSASYGITLFQDRYKDGMVYYHLGGSPPYATSLMIHPDSGFGIITLMNTDRKHLRREIPEAILDALCK